MNRGSLLLPALLIAAPPLLWLVAGASPGRRDGPHLPPSLRDIRGITISCPDDGWIWGEDSTHDCIVELAALGANWITIHPYAGIRKDGEVPEWRRLALSPPPRWLRRPIESAHRLGMKVMIKPHLGYWGSGFSWRGEIEFEHEQHWQTFFDQYSQWILKLAEVTFDVDLFIVGTELDRTVQHQKPWRVLIENLRSRHDFPLSYASNWSDFHNVPFWDALDVIGIQAYFPLVEETQPATVEAIEAGWKRIAAQLRGFAETTQRPILFTELGYNRSHQAAYRPWDDHSDGPEAEPLQLSCLRGALDVLQREDSGVIGSFLWKWFPGPRRPRNFCLQTEAVQELLKARWGSTAPTPR